MIIGEHWKHRAVKLTGGNQTLLGCFVLAICGWQHGRKPPRFGSKAVVDKDGVLITNMQAADGTIYPAHRIGSVATVRDNFRRLADKLKLSDAERNEMFEELRKWTAHDARANESKEQRGLLN